MKKIRNTVFIALAFLFVLGFASCTETLQGGPLDEILEVYGTDKRDVGTADDNGGGGSQDEGSSGAGWGS